MSALSPTAEQRALVEDLLRPLPQLLPHSRLQNAPAGESETWQAMADLGWFAAAASDDVGGAGLSIVECALMGLGLGRQLASPNVVATLFAAHLLEAAAPDLAVGLASGEQRAAFGFRSVGGGLVAADSGEVQLIVALGEQGLTVFTRETEGAVLHDARLLWASELETVRAAPTLLEVEGAVELAEAQVLLASLAAGLAAVAREAAVDYAKIREQFDQPIGGFQAIKHRCADMAMRALAAEDLVGFAAVAVSARRKDAALLAAAALNVALRAALLNAAANIQIHGGIGFSDESDAHRFLKRARLLEAIAGGSTAVRRRVLAVDASSDVANRAGPE